MRFELQRGNQEEKGVNGVQPAMQQIVQKSNRYGLGQEAMAIGEFCEDLEIMNMMMIVII